MPKVSIIIPFNNVENYIEECLKSVLCQTIKDIEIILINDASTDKSAEIVDLYKQQDSRIKILNTDKRMGQGYARNRGIEIAQGEYIGFVDSDDFIEENMFEILYNAAKQADTDITMCQTREYDDLNEKYITSSYYSLFDLSSFGENVFTAEDTKNFILDINVALWNKIYKREYLEKTGEKFPEGFIYEDLPFFFGTFTPAKRINIVWKTLYNYRINRKNSTMLQFNSKILDRPPMVSLTYEKLKQVPYMADLKQKIQGWIINDLFHRYTLLKESYHKEFFFLMKKVFKNLEIENVNDSYWSTVYHFQGYLLVMNNSFEDFNQKIFNEYIDIHETENRLRSEMVNKNEIDLIYKELNKNYKYTEELISNQESKNYKYIEELIQNQKNLYNNMYNDIKDLSFVVHDNHGELIKKIELFNEENKKTSNELNNLIKNNSEEIQFFKQEYSDKIKQLSESINKIAEKLDESIENLIKKTETEKRNRETDIEKISSEFKKALEFQQLKHNEEILNLKNEIIKRDLALREEIKPPLKKLIEKYRKKPEK